jgi:hypothetical protein
VEIGTLYVFIRSTLNFQTIITVAQIHASGNFVFCFFRSLPISNLLNRFIWILRLEVWNKFSEIDITLSINIVFIDTHYESIVTKHLEWFNLVCHIYWFVISKDIVYLIVYLLVHLVVVIMFFILSFNTLYIDPYKSSWYNYSYTWNNQRAQRIR